MGIVDHQFVPRGQAVNGQFYLEVMKCLREAERRNQPTLQIWPLRTFSFVPEVEIHSERSPITDDRRDRRKFAMGTRRYPAKRVPELELRLEAVYRQWRGVL
jgi:hypothetical protein